MDYKVEFDINTFEFWSGAKNVIETLKEQNKLKKLEELLEFVFDNQIPSEVEINDFVWFDAIDMLNNENE